MPSVTPARIPWYMFMHCDSMASLKCGRSDCHRLAICFPGLDRLARLLDLLEYGGVIEGVGSDYFRGLSVERDIE